MELGLSDNEELADAGEVEELTLVESEEIEANEPEELSDGMELGLSDDEELADAEEVVEELTLNEPEELPDDMELKLTGIESSVDVETTKSLVDAGVNTEELSLASVEQTELSDTNAYLQSENELDTVNADEDLGLSFSDFADEMENADKKSKIDAETEEEKTYDPDYIPDFALGEFKLATDDDTVSSTDIPSSAIAQELDIELENELKEVEAIVESDDTKSQVSSLDIQAAMEGFVNTMEPDDTIHAVQQTFTGENADEQLAEASLAQDFSEVEQELQDNIEEDSEDDVDKEAEINEDIDELYTDNVMEPAFEHSASYKKKKKSPAGLVGGMFVLIVALGVLGFINKETILSKLPGAATVESVPNELAAPVENTVAQQPKKDVLETEAEAMLNDIEEPVQLLDTSVSISAMTVDCDVPAYMINTHSRRYLVKLAKRMQLQLKNALLIAGEQPLANKIVVDLSVDKDVLKYEKISSSSGSKKVDEIVSSTTQVVLKDTQPYAGTFGQNQGIIKLIVKF